MFSKNQSNSRKSMSKMPTKKNDGAPMIPFIDILKSKNFPQPILPMPCRIDKVVNGSTSLTMLLKKPISIEYDSKIITYDFHKLYLSFYQNIIYYAKIKYKEMTQRELPISLAKKWWVQSKPLKGQIKNYSQDIDFLLTSYLKAYINYLQSNNQEEALLEYCKEIIDYCQKKIEENSITFNFKEKEITKRMYRTKKKYHFPDIWEFDVLSEETQKTTRKAFIPVMIYDDLLESFLYNKMNLEKKMGNLQEEYGETEENEDEIDVNSIEFVGFKELEDMKIIVHIPTNQYKENDVDLKNIINKIEFSDIFIDVEEEDDDFFNI
ncbi:hypothetical protein [Candidatus Lokiarchaeum ossiferum]|uniref:hypothetical protein n=1 Tax=Candidatus Lokiarchaeum ossiferum TaxID=2951803 RepID=UPI00352C35A7